MMRDWVDCFLMFRDTLPTSLNDENILSRLLLYLYETELNLTDRSHPGACSQANFGISDTVIVIFLDSIIHPPSSNSLRN